LEKKMIDRAAFLGIPSDALVLLGIFAVWILLQYVILPRLGVPT
jgi:hypothetical protein